MLDFKSYVDVQAQLEAAQSDDEDNRADATEILHFLNDKDGQWEQGVISQRGSTRPRYTFDMCNPIVKQVAGRLQESDFGIKIRPAGGDASTDTAKTYAGMIRNIENLSKAKSQVYNPAIKKMIQMGIAGWAVKQEYADSRSFHQDLIIEPIYNFLESVWYDPQSQKQDRSDAMYAWWLKPLSLNDYKATFPKGSGTSVGKNTSVFSYWNKPEFITVAVFYFLKSKKVTLVQMSNGAVYEKDSDAYKKVADELRGMGVTELGERVADVDTCFQRIYDGGGWLTEAEETAFDTIPLVPLYGNYDIIDDKIIYRGEVNHLMDAQRVFNYSETKKVEETALSPKSKILATLKQIAAHKTSWETMNTNNEPVLPFDIDPENPNPPFRLPGGDINPGLESVSANMRANMQATSGLFAANMGQNPFQQSGIALENQIDQGHEGKFDYFDSIKIAITRTAEILVAAIPKVYDTTREIRLMNADGTFDTAMINDVVIDQQTGQEVELNNLNKGIYDVVCDIGQSYKNRQQEGNEAILRMAEIDPQFLQQAKDLFINNMRELPGMSAMHERIREQMVKSGQIPESQLTEEEAAMMQQMAQNQQNQPPDPNQMIAESDARRAETESQTAQANLQIKSIELDQAQQKLDQDNKVIEINMYAKQKELELKEREAAIKEMAAISSASKTMADMGLNVDKMESEITERYTKAMKNLVDIGVTDPVGMINDIEDMWIGDYNYDPQTGELSRRG